jgi:transposase
VGALGRSALDFHGQELRLIDAELARIALSCEETKRLMTIPGVDVTVALSIADAVGVFSRFGSPSKLVRYLGLNPRSSSLAINPPRMGGSRSRGRAHARGMLVEAAWVAVKTPGRCARSSKRVRAHEMAIAEQAERAHAQMVTDRQARAPRDGRGRQWGATVKALCGGTLRGRPQPLILRFARGSTTPTPRRTPPARTVHHARPPLTSSVGVGR